MNIETKLFKKYKEFIVNNSKYALTDCIYNDTPQQLSEFPTILFLENDSSNENISTEKLEYIDKFQYKIEIYTKNKKYNSVMIPRKEISNEIKYLTFEFLRLYGLDRTSCTKGEYLDLNIDRTVIICECEVSNWDGKIR